jgi:hypothetical protein
MAKDDSGTGGKDPKRAQQVKYGAAIGSAALAAALLYAGRHKIRKHAETVIKKVRDDDPAGKDDAAEENDQ